MAKRRLKFAKSVISRMVNDGKSTPEKIEQQKKVVEDLQEEVKKLSPPTQARPMAITPNAG
jgi:cell division protein FtsL